MLTIRDVTKLRDLQQAEKQNEYLNMLTSTVTHEMMTPLNCILTFAKSIIDFKSSRKVTEEAGMIFKSTSLMKLYVSDLLDRTRAQTGTLNFKFESQNLQSLI
jgi:K+-sensing histidine kinase KdpD